MHNPLGQSAPEQHCAVVHAPPQQRLPGPHWVSLVQVWHRPLAQTRPALQSADWQHSPAEQAPPQQRSPTEHCEFVVHALQRPLTQAPLHSALLQQSAAGRQPPLQHLPVPPSADEQSRSPLQVSHEFPMQGLPPHWLAEQQLPTTHAPPQHTAAGPHWASLAQGAHWLLVQSPPPGQSEFAQH
jgi:hypothetical protein